MASKTLRWAAVSSVLAIHQLRLQQPNSSNGSNSSSSSSLGARVGKLHLPMAHISLHLYTHCSCYHEPKSASLWLACPTGYSPSFQCAYGRTYSSQRGMSTRVCAAINKLHLPSRTTMAHHPSHGTPLITILEDFPFEDEACSNDEISCSACTLKTSNAVGSRSLPETMSEPKLDENAGLSEWFPKGARGAALTKFFEKHGVLKHECLGLDASNVFGDDAPPPVISETTTAKVAGMETLVWGLAQQGLTEAGYNAIVSGFFGDDDSSQDTGSQERLLETETSNEPPQHEPPTIFRWCLPCCSSNSEKEAANFSEQAYDPPVGFLKMNRDGNSPAVAPSQSEPEPVTEPVPEPNKLAAAPKEPLAKKASSSAKRPSISNEREGKAKDLSPADFSFYAVNSIGDTGSIHLLPRLPEEDAQEEVSLGAEKVDATVLSNGEPAQIGVDHATAGGAVVGLNAVIDTGNEGEQRPEQLADEDEESMQFSYPSTGSSALEAFVLAKQK